MYSRIFFTNIIRIMEERKISNGELHAISGVSPSFISDLTRGKGNPSLKTMESLAEALSVPLPLMLEHVESEVWEYFEKEENKTCVPLPTGFERVGAILPSHKAFIVKRWDEATRKHLKK